MSAALPLALFPVRGRTPLYAVLAAIFVAWLVLMLALASKAPFAPAGARILFETSSLVLAFIGALQIKGLVRASEVAAKMQIPHTLWRKWVRACVIETSLVWIFLATTMSMLLASPTSTMPWPAAVALLSFSVGLGAAGMLAYLEILPKKPALLVYVGSATLLLAALWLGAGALVPRFASLPSVMLGVLALSWPALGATLMLKWRRRQDTLRWSPPSRRSRWRLSVESQVLRYSPLDAKNYWLWGKSPKKITVRTRLFWMASALLPLHIFSDSLSHLGWQQEPDARHLLSLGVLCVFMTYSLVARDLHWRSLLVPGGWRRGQIASDIFASTLKIQLLGLAAAATIYVVWQTLYYGAPISIVLEVLAADALLPFEAALAVSVALVIRALPRHSIVSVAAIAAIFGCWLNLRFGIDYPNLRHFPAGGMLYAALMAAATHAMLRLANRVWTTEKLMDCARGGG